MSVQFEGYERRIAKIEKALKEYGIESLEAARDLCLSKGVNVEEIVKGVQPIAFENAGPRHRHCRQRGESRRRYHRQIRV